MRLGPALAIVPVACGLIAAGASACAPAVDDSAESLEHAYTSNGLGLRLVYDEGSHRVRATVERPLADGESLRLAVRRGRLSSDVSGAVDCASLPVALPLAEADAGVVESTGLEAGADAGSSVDGEAQTAGGAEVDGAVVADAGALTGDGGPVVVGAAGYVGPVVIYEGPEIDPSLLATVYESDWIVANVSAESLDRLAREGADSIVEACIVSPQAARIARASLRTSIQCAWDERDPKASASMQRRSCTSR